MSLSPINISQILKDHDLSPKKSLGQNFLSNDDVLAKIIDAAEIEKNSEVLEIGPGLGSLTRHIAEKARQVTVVELDGRLIPILEEIMSPWDNVNIIHEDILKLDPAVIMQNDRYVVAANIPYYITSALIRHLLEAEKKPARMVLTVQAEVAKRICAKPGDLSLLGLSVQVYGIPKIMLRIPAGAFYPPPKVDSIALRVDLFQEPLIPTEELDVFFRIAKAGFSQKRKTLRNSISAGLQMEKTETDLLLTQSGIDPATRAQNLNLEEWANLTKNFIAKN